MYLVPGWLAAAILLCSWTQMCVSEAEECQESSGGFGPGGGGDLLTHCSLGQAKLLVFH